MNELEKQFFDTFGIEPREVYPPQDELFGTREEMTEFFNEAYPQITDRILLGIIAKICWTYRCTQNDFDLYEVSTVEGLKEAVLKHAIELSKNDDYIYCEVQALFEEG